MWMNRATARSSTTRRCGLCGRRARGNRRRAWAWSRATSTATATRDLFMTHLRDGDEHHLRERRNRALPGRRSGESGLGQPSWTEDRLRHRALRLRKRRHRRPLRRERRGEADRGAAARLATRIPVREENELYRGLGKGKYEEIPAGAAGAARALRGGPRRRGGRPRQRRGHRPRGREQRGSGPAAPAQQPALGAATWVRGCSGRSKDGISSARPRRSPAARPRGRGAPTPTAATPRPEIRAFCSRCRPERRAHSTCAGPTARAIAT